MNKLLSALTASILTAPFALAEPQLPRDVRGWQTHDSLGCMMMRECVEGTLAISSAADLDVAFPYSNFENDRDEIDALIVELNKMGVNVYLAAERYFPSGHAGVYYTVGNDFFMNEKYGDDPVQFVQTLRHEAWHAAQDAMACSIDNSNIAIIYPMENVPPAYVLAAEIAYPPSARPWEQEAKWAGATPGMTLDVLRIINESGGRPWTVIDPTPKTAEWLARKGCM